MNLHTFCVQFLCAIFKLKILITLANVVLHTTLFLPSSHRSKGINRLGLEHLMKTILALLIPFCAIALPALGELTTQDLEKIRQIVKESETALTSRIEKVDSKVGAIETRLRTVETGVAELRGRSIGFGILRDGLVPICAIGAFIISIVALVKAQPKAPQTRQDTPKAVSQ